MSWLSSIHPEKTLPILKDGVPIQSFHAIRPFIAPGPRLKRESIGLVQGDLNGGRRCGMCHNGRLGRQHDQDHKQDDGCLFEKLNHLHSKILCRQIDYFTPSRSEF